MNSVYIYHHLGLGDHIIANGMVRTIAKQYEIVYLFCKPRNFKNVSFMYRDLDNLKIIVAEDNTVKNFIKFNPNNNYIIAGHNSFQKIFDNPKNKLHIDEIFYKLANVSFENKWDEFFIKRNLEREKELFNKLGLSVNEEYVFVHDKEDNKIIKEIPNIKIIKPDNTDYLLFDFLYVIEHAKEIHCINSSFFCLIDCIKTINSDKMCIHDYNLSDYSFKLMGKFRKCWKLIT